MNKYSIKKKDSFFNISAIKISPCLELSRFEKMRISKKIRNKDLQHFYDTIVDSNPNYDYSYMYNNLAELRISRIFIKNPKLIGRKVAAYYNCIKNKIKYTKKIKDKVLPHELLHMASTIKEDNTNLIYSGFSQVIKLKNIESIGRGINEGYTQLLCERYFKVNYKSYPLEVFIATKIEDIIGREKMEKMYFSADLYGLTQEFLKYKTEKEVILFFRSMDFLGTLYCRKNIDHELKILKISYKRVIEFLFSIKSARLIEERVPLQLGIKQLIEYSKNFEYNIIDRKENKCISIISESEIVKILNKYINVIEEEYFYNQQKTYLK